MGTDHFFTYVDEHGTPQNANVARLMSYITVTTAPPRVLTSFKWTPRTT